VNAASALSYTSSVMPSAPATAASVASQMAYGGISRMYTQPPPPAAVQQQIPSRSSNISQQNVFSAPPTRTTAPSTASSSSLQSHKTSYSDDSRGIGASSLVIEAKPVLRNKMAEITKFVPTAVMVKRDTKTKTTATRKHFNFHLIKYKSYFVYHVSLL
jgi:hypothetical protein